MQQKLIWTLDDHRTPEAVCSHLQQALGELRSGAVDPADLLITNRASKRLGDYQQLTRTVAALERSTEAGFNPQPGQDVSYVVVNDEKASRDRVQLEYEDLDRYDPDFYAEMLIDAAETVCAPLGWRRDRIDRYLADRTMALSKTTDTGSLWYWTPSDTSQLTSQRTWSLFDRFTEFIGILPNS